MNGPQELRAVACNECAAQGRYRVGLAGNETVMGNLWVGWGGIPERHEVVTSSNATSELAVQGESSTQSRWLLFAVGPEEAQ